VEFLKTGLEGSAAIRLELYAQVMKQLTDNPNAASAIKGWHMIALMLSTYPPPEQIENFVAMFIRKEVMTSYSPPRSFFPYCVMSNKKLTNLFLITWDM
jgi:Rho GTPase-activating protein 39